MAIEPDSMRGYGTGATLKAAGARTLRIWHYATNDDHATVAAAGYFNAMRPFVGVGDIVHASLDLDGTPALRIYMFNAVPATGNVTVVQVANA